MQKKNNIAIYSALFGNRDVFKEQPRIDGVDYYLFTDDPRIKSNHTKIILEKGIYSDPTRSAKIYKVLPNLYFPDYEYTIWIDASISLKGNKIISLLNESLNNTDIAFFKHPYRDCVYVEAEECIKLKKDSDELINNQMNAYRRMGYPYNNGLLKGGVILRRNKQKDIIRFNKAWWDQICMFSRRDQLSLPYVLWKEDVKFHIINEFIWVNDYFIIENSNEAKEFKAKI